MCNSFQIMFHLLIILFLYFFLTLHCCSQVLQLLSNSYYCCINDNNFVNHLRITVCIVSEVEWFCSTVVVNYASSCGGSSIIIGRRPADGSCGGGGYCAIINCSSSVVTWISRCLVLVGLSITDRWASGWPMMHGPRTTPTKESWLVRCMKEYLYESTANVSLYESMSLFRGRDSVMSIKVDACGRWCSR